MFLLCHSDLFVLAQLVSNQSSVHSHQRCSIGKGVLKISKNSQENICASLFFNKVAGLMSATILKKRLWHRCFPVNFAKFLRTPLLQNATGQLLLNIYIIVIKTFYHFCFLCYNFIL